MIGPGTVTEQNYPEFKKTYKKAADKKLESFMFQSNEVLTGYAKYLCEYVETQRGWRP